MAREHANLRLDIWGDDDWRALTRDGQWLYELLLTHPKTNRAGVCEWHPGRLALMSRGTTVDEIVTMAAELIGTHFIVVDEATGEVVIRSYIKHDGVLKQPNMTTTMANDWAGLASPTIRAVIAFELQKLRDADPGLPAWRNKRVMTILEAHAVNAKALPIAEPLVPTIGLPIALPKALPIGLPIPLGSPTSTTTSTTTEASLLSDEARKKPEVRIPAGWAPTSAHFERAKTNHLDIAKEAEAFRNHAETHDRHAANWNAAFTTWLTKAKPTEKAKLDPNAWMQR